MWYVVQYLKQPDLASFAIGSNARPLEFITLDASDTHSGRVTQPFLSSISDSHLVELPVFFIMYTNTLSQINIVTPCQSPYKNRKGPCVQAVSDSHLLPFKFPSRSS